jgi:hypothetical protein
MHVIDYITPLFFIAGAVIGGFLGHYFCSFKLKTAIEREKIKIEQLQHELTVIERQQLLKQEKDIAIHDTEKIRDIEIARKEGYDAGKKEILSDFRIECYPFIEVRKGFFIKYHTIYGYKYRLFVKNVPALSEITQIEGKYKEFDEEVKQRIIKIFDTAIENFTVKGLGNIPCEILPLKEFIRKK